MYGAISRSEADATAQRLAAVRVAGGVEVAVASVAGRSFAQSLHETGGYKARFPVGRRGLEAALINTGGGIAGGDRVRFSVVAGPAADVTIATPAAERIYRSLGPSAAIDVQLSAAPGARLAWLPQETILFNGARLERRLEADVSARARLLVVEMLVLGRAAMGETLAGGRVRDNWRIRRDGALVLAEAVRLDGAIGELLGEPAVAAGAMALATLVLVASDAGDHLECARAALRDGPAASAASTWNGLLAVRAMAGSAEALRQSIGRAIEAIDGRPLPGVWGA